MLFLFISVSHSKTEFIFAPYSFARVNADASITTFTVLMAYKVIADSGEFNYELTVKGLNVYDKINLINGATIHAQNFMFDSSQGNFYTDIIYFKPLTDDAIQFAFVDSSGVIRNIMTSDNTYGTSRYVYTLQTGNINPQDFMKLQSNWIAISPPRATNGEHYLVMVSSGGWFLDTDGVTYHYYRKGLECSTTVYAQGFEGYILRISTIYGNSPVFVPEGFRFADGTVIDSTNTFIVTVSTQGLANYDDVQKSTSDLKLLIGQEITDRGVAVAEVWLSTPDYVSGKGISSGTVSILIAGSNSNQKTKSIADYVCDGTNDSTILQNAIDSLTFGKINIDGTLTLNYPIYLTSKNGITIEGYGENSTLKIKNSASGWTASTDTVTGLFTTSGNSNIIIRNLILDGNSSNQGMRASKTVYSSGSESDWTIDNCIIQNFNNMTQSGGIYIGQSNTAVNIKIINNKFISVGNSGTNSCVSIIYSGSNKIIVKDNMATTCRLFCELTKTSNADISHNILSGGAGFVVLTTVSSCTITNNNISNETGTAISLSISGNENSIENNIFNNSASGIMIRVAGLRNSIIGNKMYSLTSCQQGIFDNGTTGDIIALNTVYNNTASNGDGIYVNSSSTTIIGNKCNSNNRYGFNITVTAGIITGNEAYDNGTANASITKTGRVVDNNNSWNSDNLFTDGSNAMTGILNMGNNSINNCPEIIKSTTQAEVVISSSPLWSKAVQDVIATQKSTGVIEGQIAVIISTDGLQWIMLGNNSANISAIALSTAGLQFVIGIDSVSAVNDLCGTPTLFNWNLKRLFGFLDTPATGSDFIADCYISNSANVVATINIPVGCSSSTVVNISSQVPSGYWFKARVKQIGSTVAGSDFRINGEYTK